MLKITVTCFALVSVLFLGKTLNYADQPKQKRSGMLTGTLQKMIVQSGSVTMQFDLNRLNGISSVAGKPTTLRFVAAANSFFSVLVFHDQLRGPEPGSIALVPAAGGNATGYSLPVTLGASLKQLVIEKLSSDAGFDLAM